MLLFLLCLLGIFSQSVLANTSSCSVEDLRTCRSDALEQMSGSSRSDGGSHEEKQCRDLRENFDCILWQTSMCFKKEDQDSNSDVIMKTWRHLQGFCEKYGNWWAKSCFQRDDVKRCESLLPAKRNSLDGPSCRMFVNFRDCVASIAGNDCSSSDRSLLASYFMEKGQQMAWRCPKDSDLASMSSASAQQMERYPNMYGDQPGSGYDVSCVASTRNDLAKCSEKYTTSQAEAAGRDDSDMRNHKMCCGLIDMKECVLDAAVKHCGDNAKSFADKTILTMAPTIDACKDFTPSKCSAASSIYSAKAVAVNLLLYLVYCAYVKKFF